MNDFSSIHVIYFLKEKAIFKKEPTTFEEYDVIEFVLESAEDGSNEFYF